MKAQDLKNSILQLAIQGRLVAQDANDEPAEVLYAKIQAEKQKLIKEGKIKKDKPLPPIADDEIPFEIPSTWKWVRLGDIFNIVMGQSPDGDSVSHVALLNGIEFHQGKSFFSETYLLHSDVYTNSPTKIVENNTNILCVRAPVGIVNITERKICIGRGLCGVVIYNQLVALKLLFYFLQSMENDFNKKSTGTTFKAITGDVVSQQLFPLPPLAEQKRIVAKIEELEPLVKQYDKAETELSALNGSFPEQLKKSILQYAIQGKLVAQDANDESAEALYAKIQAEKQMLIKEGKIKKDKPLPPITDDEVPFAIPSTWKWVRLGDIGESRIGLTYHPEDISDDGMIVLRSSNIQNNKLSFNDVVRVKVSVPNNLLVNTGDIIICARNGSKALVGKSAIIQDIKEPMTFGAFMAIYKSPINEYVKIYLDSPLFKKTLDAVNTVTINQITQKNLNNAIIPLPPLAEQKRIVSKVNDLMQYCEELGHPEKRKNVEPITIGWLIDKGFASCQQNGYTDVNAILDELGIAVMQDRNLKKGRIEYNNDKFQIWVNDLNDNWTKTHELVHYVNDNNEIKLYGAVGRKDETSLSKSKERNVDVLTAEILMPEDIFVSAVEQDNIGKYAFVDNATIRKLGKQFRVSDDAVKIRLQNLGYHTK